MSEKDFNGFVKRFNELVKSRGLMRKTIVDDCKISDRALRYYTHGQRPMPIDVAITLADYFDVSLDYLVGRSDDPARHP